MTVINHKSISGVTSITAPAGSDNLFTVHTNDTTERLRIKSDGNVGIGTDSIISKVVVEGTGDGTTGSSYLADIAAAASLFLKTHSGSSVGLALGGRTTGGQYIQAAYQNSTVVSVRDLCINPHGGGVGIGTFAPNFGANPGADTIVFGTSQTERLRITSAGRLGIGTDNPDMKVEVYNGGIKIDRRDGGGTSNPHFSMRTGPNGSSRLMIYAEDHTDDNSNWVYKTNANEDHIFHTAAVERLRIESDGSVGIGTDDASWGLSGGGGLVVGDGSGAQAITIFCSGNADLSFGDAKSGTARYAGLIRYNHTDDYMAFRTATQERLRITSAGRVGINENSPDTDLHIKNTNPAIILEGTNNSGRQHKIWSSGTNSESLQFTSGNLLYNGDVHYFRASNESTEYARIGSVGEIQIGTTSWPTGTMAKAAGRVLVGGGGDLTLWNETNSAGGVASFKLACKEGGDATKIGYVQFFGGTENTSDQKGFLKVNVSDANGSGQERLRIDSSGNIGQSVTPSGWASAQAGDFYAFQIGTGMAIFGRGSGDEDRGGISCNYYNTASAQKYIGNGHAGRIYFEDGSIVFSNAAQNSSGAGAAMTLNERLRIDSSGRLLLGTDTAGDSTADDLTIANSAVCGITIRSGTSSEGNIFFADGTSGDSRYRGMLRYDHNVDAMIFKVTGSERLRIASDGNVSIGHGGEHSGSHRLWVESPGVSLSEISFEDASGTGQLNLAGSNSHVRLQFGTMDVSPYAGWIQASFDNTPDSSGTGDSGTEPLLINPKGGNVGINEADNINGRLHVQHDALAENILYATRYNDQGNDKPILSITEAVMSTSGDSALVIGNHNRDIHIGPVFGSNAAVTTTNGRGILIKSDGRVLLSDDIGSVIPSRLPELDVQLMIYTSTNGQAIANNDCARVLIATDAKQTGAQGYHGALDFGSSDCSASGSSNEWNWRTASIMCRGDGDTSTSVADGDLQFWTKSASGSLTHRFDIAPNGSLTGTDQSIGSLSDQRLKTNIQDYTYDLNKFKQLKTRTFDWINPEFHQEGNQRGFVAQEVETVDPYWNYQFEVSKESAEKDYNLLSDGDENYTIRDHRPGKASKLNGKDAMYVSVIQQLMSKIETLEAKVAALEGS